MKLESSSSILKAALEEFKPTHIVSMVSGGKDSAASDQIARELGVKIDFVMHGNTRCGIPETTEFVRDTYGKLGEYVEADAGNAYEEYVMRKGFFGKGVAAHAYSYRVLKAGPFRKTLSSMIRKGKHNIRILLLNGARKDESANRKRTLEVFRRDPASKNNVWVNLIHDWTLEDRDSYLNSRGTCINPVAKKLCRSGECMCGTMQSKEERLEAGIAYPKWGRWLDDLEKEAMRLHGFGWNDTFKVRETKPEFQPMCEECKSITGKEE